MGVVSTTGLFKHTLNQLNQLDKASAGSLTTWLLMRRLAIPWWRRMRVLAMVVLARATMTIVLDTLYIVGPDVPQVGRAAVAGRLELR